MARSPLIIDTPMGKLYCIDLGSGAAMLMIEQDGQAITFPIDSQEAKHIAGYLRGPALGRPVGTQPITDDDVKEAAALYTSPDADAAPNRLMYVVEQMGISKGRANSLIVKARQEGIMTQRYSTGGRLISDEAN